jgi:hypothetical protein
VIKGLTGNKFFTTPDVTIFRPDVTISRRI